MGDHGSPRTPQVYAIPDAGSIAGSLTTYIAITRPMNYVSFDTSLAVKWCFAETAAAAVTAFAALACDRVRSAGKGEIPCVGKQGTNLYFEALSGSGVAAAATTGISLVPHFGREV